MSDTELPSNMDKISDFVCLALLEVCSGAWQHCFAKVLDQLRRRVADIARLDNKRLWAGLFGDGNVCACLLLRQNSRTRLPIQKERKTDTSWHEDNTFSLKCIVNIMDGIYVIIYNVCLELL